MCHMAQETALLIYYDEEYKWIYERSHIWTAEKDMKTWLIIAVIYNLSNCEVKAWKKNQAWTAFLYSSLPKGILPTHNVTSSQLAR